MYVFITKTKKTILFMAIIAVYSGNIPKASDIASRQIAKFFSLKCVVIAVITLPLKFNCVNSGRRCR